MKRILKIFLTLVLAVSMMLEMVPVNRVYAEGEAVEETTTEPAAQETDQGSTEGTNEQDTTDVQTEGTDELPAVEEEQTEEEAEVPAEAPVVEDNAGEEETVELNETAPETDSEEDVVLNAESFELEKELDNGLKVTVAFKAGTVPEGTEVVITPAKEEALEAAKAARGEDYEAMGADISFVYNGEEIEPKDYSENKVSVTLSFEGQEELGSDFETSHLKESTDEEGNVVYTPEKVKAVMTDITKEVEVEYEETWTETVTKYKEVDVYGDVEVEYEEEVPVYETREITEERTEYVTKTREVEKTRYVRVKVAVKWYDPTTWLGYKIVEEKYTVTEEYQEPVTVTVVVGTEQVQVGTEKVKKTRTERGVVGTETVEDGTEEIVHTETKTRTETIVVGQTASFESDEFSTFTVTWYWYYSTYSTTVHHGIMQNGSFVEFGTNGLPSSSNSVYPSSLNINNYGTSNDNRYAYLIYDFPGYSYSATYYRTNESSTPATGGTSIRPVLRKEDNTTWNYRRTDSWNRDVANGSHIYVIYTPKTISQGADGSGSGGGDGQDQFTPDVGKNVSDQKEDGTYDITLGFVGDKQPASYAKARVIVVFDRSGSMDDPVSSSDTTVRLTAAKNAVNAMAKTLLGLTDTEGNKLVEMGLVSFGTNAQIETFGNNVQFTSNYDTGNGADRFKAKVDSFTTSNLMGGTNWEKALDLANSMAAATDAKTYIVFISDGDPTFRISRGNYLDYNTGSGSNIVYGIAEETRGNNDDYFYSDGVFGYGTNDRDTNNRCYDAAELVGTSIVKAHKAFFVVGLSSDVARMSDLATDTGGTYYDGSNATTFADNMATIAGKIADEVGLTDMTITDGVTDMTQVETEALIGTAGDFEYFKSYPLTQEESGYSYKIGETTYNVSQAQVDAGSDGTHRIYTRTSSSGTNVIYIEYPWSIPEDAKAEVNSNNAVVWDTSAVNSELEHGVYYSVKFTVWPKQEAYDLIADLDNGIRKVTDTDLEAGTKAQLRVLVNGTTYEYDTATGTWTGGLSDAQLQALIDDENNDPVFSMKTNTGLSASYKYGGAEKTASYTNYTNGNMSLDDTAIMIKKTWNNYLDARDASDVTLTITRNGEDYMNVAMGDPVEESTDQGKHWIQKPDHELYISLGVLSVNGSDITVREKGYDYTVIEPANFSYRWDLSADIYHPMVINGKTTILIEVQDESTVPEAIQNLEENKTASAGEKTYYRFNDVLYVVSEKTLLEATNDRRSNLIINKVVKDETAPEEDVFPIQMTINNPNANHPGDTGYNFWYDASWFYVSTEENNRDTIVLDGVTVEGATPEISELRLGNSHITNIQPHEADDDYPYDYITYYYDGTLNTVKAVDLEIHRGTETIGDVTTEYTYYSYYTGFYWFDNAETATVYIRDGWYVNVNNMGRGTEYTIVEPTEKMPDAYTFDKATSDYSNITGDAATPAEIDEYTATGTIDIPNTDFKVTYNNNYEGVYYVYHSSDNTVERFPMAIDGVKVTSFNIFGMTAENALYGGYYTDYAGKSTGYDSADLTYDENNKSKDSGEDAKAYSYQYIKDSNRNAWSINNAYDQDGTEAVPVKDTTYYLKEVPNSYMLPYTHYTYYKTGYKLANIWTITAVDDLNYTGAGFVVETEDREATIVESLKIKAANSSTTTTLTPEKLYKAKGILAGYLGYNDITEFMSEGTIIIKQYWTTPDGITIKGTTQRTLTFGDGTITGLKKTDSPCKD